MDPSLQHKFFEAGPCLSKEKLIQYHNGVLSAKENNTIEKHVLGCNLCSEALEGIAFSSAASSSIKEIDTNIKILTGTVAAGSFLNWKSGLAIAATLTGVVFGMLWLIRDISPENNLAENKPKVEAKVKDQALPQKETTDEKVSENESSPLVVEEPRVSEVSLPVEELAESMEELEEDIEEIAMVGSAVSGNLSLSEDLVDESEEESTAMVAEIPQREIKSMSAKSAMAGSADKEVMALGNGKATLPTIYLNELLVVDYSDIYTELDAVDQDQESAKQMLQSVSAAYANDSEREESRQSLMDEEEITIDYDYEDVLNDALIEYKKEKYGKAIRALNLILEKYPQDHNGLFYKALCLSKTKKYTAAITLFDEVYHLPQTPFQLDAEWNKALVLIKNNEVEKGKQLLLKIKTEGKYYSPFAAKELEKI
ncbi:hypothetical protein N9R81_01075 [Flavobacteriales bacterium]|nr:hypothetical protein [Flavobacteriales bacterium]